MAWRKSITFNLEGLNQEQYLKLAKKAIENLNWVITDIASYGIIARIKSFLDPWGEEFIIRVEDKTVNIYSKCVRTMVIFDLGKNKININRFLSEFEQQKSNYSLEEIDNMINIDNIKDDITEILDYAEEVYENQNFALGILSGLSAGSAALFVWFVFAGIITEGGYAWSFGIPFIVGFSIRYGGKGVTKSFKMAGGLLSLLFCVAGRFISICYLHIEGYEIMTPSLLFEMTTEGFFEIMEAYFLYSDILFYFFAFAMGYVLSQHQLKKII